MDARHCSSMPLVDPVLVVPAAFVDSRQGDS
jgi:hypothetical protein